MKRREFLKGIAASAAGVASANATSVISDDLMNSEDAPITASHFGAVRALRRKCAAGVRSALITASSFTGWRQCLPLSWARSGLRAADTALAIITATAAALAPQLR